MKNKLTKNWVLKLVSLCISIIVWFVVANINNPLVTSNHTVVSSDIQLVNTEVIDSMGKMAIPLDNNDILRISITGNRKQVRSITSASIKVTADISQAESLETNPVLVPIVVNVEGASQNKIEWYPNNLKVKLENKKTQEFPIIVTEGETRPDKGYEIGVRSSNPAKIKITGPESLIDKIDYVQAKVNIEGASKDVTQEVSVTVYDKNGESMADRLSSLNITSSVKATIRLWEVRGGISVQAQDNDVRRLLTGHVKDGYRVADVKILPETVSVAGSEEGLEALKEMGNILTLPDHCVDVEGLDDDFDGALDFSLSSLLPEGVILSSSSSDDLLVTATVLPENGMVWKYLTMNISRFPESSDDIEVTYDTDEVDFRILKEDPDAPELTDSDISAFIDVSGLDLGSHEVVVNVDLPDGYSLLAEPVAQISITKTMVNDGEDTQ